MISFKSRVRNRFGVGFSVKLGVRVRRRHLWGEAWNHNGTKGFSTFDPTWNRSKQSEWDMRRRLYSREMDFRIRVILRGRVVSGAATWRNEEAEARKIRADKFV
jgi:hypothetical protein